MNPPSLHEIELGCCGWSYKDWVGPFYPAGTKSADYLQLYATRFDLVEVDSTFYGIPAARTVQRWYDETPAAFRFALKMPQVITHEKVLRDCGRELSDFLEVAELLREKLRCICMQFGYFNARKFLGVSEFLDLLRPFLSQWNPDVPLAIEIRNRDWFSTEFLDCLRTYRVSLVLVQQNWMPSPRQMMDRIDVATGPLGYVRLLGDRKKIEQITRKWDRTVLDRQQEIQATATAIQSLAVKVPVLLFANNHYAGHGPDTVEAMRDCLSA